MHWENTCRFLFQFLKNIFWGSKILVPSPKMDQKHQSWHKEAKIDQIWLKFGTLLQWVSTCRFFLFQLLKILIFASRRLGPNPKMDQKPQQWLQKWSDLAEIWYTCALSEYLRVCNSFFENSYFGVQETRSNWPFLQALKISKSSFSVIFHQVVLFNIS